MCLRSLAATTLFSICMMGCGANTNGPENDANGPGNVVDNGGNEQSSPEDSSTSWDFPDDTVLKVEINPAPPSAETPVTLTAQRRYDTGAHAPLKSLHYRVVSEPDAQGEWIAFSEPSLNDLGDGLVDSIYSATVSLPQGSAFIQFKADQETGQPHELKDWSVVVK